MEVSYLIKKERVSDLIACYRELLAGTQEEVLLERYNTIDVQVAIELESKGIMVDQLQQFVMKRDAKLVKAQRGKL